MPYTKYRFERVMLGILILFVSAPAWAADTDKTLFCKRYAQAHQPSDDVRYKPGVDIKGKAVAPADLNSGLNTSTLYPVRIPIVMDMIERYGLDMPEGVMGEAYIGEIAVYEDGRTTFNGEDISANMQTYCLEYISQPEGKMPDNSP